MEEAVKRTRDELVEYVREQRRVSVLSGPSIVPLWWQGLDKCLSVQWVISLEGGFPE